MTAIRIRDNYSFGDHYFSLFIHSSSDDPESLLSPT